MTKQKPIEIITPPNALKAKVGGAIPALDQKAIARAEAALERMSGPVCGLDQRGAGAAAGRVGQV